VTEPLRWHSRALTHCGAVRTMNEDSMIERPDAGLWAVADGMGGHDAGEVASGMIVEGLASLSCREPLADLVDTLEDNVLDVHQRIRHYSRTHCNGRTVGSTLVSMLARGDTGVCLWAGDSRLYRIRDGQLTQISEDHSQVNEMIAKGLLTREEAKRHPAGNVITRAVGALDTLYLDVAVFELRPGDIYLLCSDGLYGAVDEQRFVDRLAGASIEAATQGLIDDALANRARDNVTLVAIRME
jgi:serine/threonine protein phosphatase PrpC